MLLRENSREKVKNGRKKKERRKELNDRQIRTSSQNKYDVKSMSTYRCIKIEARR
jgi:hypothetical protein